MMRSFRLRVKLLELEMKPKKNKKLLRNYMKNLRNVNLNKNS